MVSNAFYDSNSIMVELLIQLADDTALVTNGGSYTFDVNVEYGSDGRKKSFPMQTIEATHDKTVVNFVSLMSIPMYIRKSSTNQVTFPLCFPDFG